MTGLLSPLYRYCTAFAQRLERSHSRRQLLAKNERVIADMGFSRALLLEGVRAWPWRLPEEDDSEDCRLRDPLIPVPRIVESNDRGDTAMKRQRLEQQDGMESRNYKRLEETNVHKSVA